MNCGVDDKLTDREELFVLEYCKCLNRAKAAVAAGYSEESMYFTGSVLLRKPNVLRAVQTEMQRKANDLRLGADYLVLQAHDSYLRATEAGQHAAANKFLDMLFKHLGLYLADNKQKTTASELEEAKRQMRELGFDIDAIKPIVASGKKTES